MTTKRLALSMLALGLTSGPTAHAQPPDTPADFDERVNAPRRSFELTLGTGYTQGFGQFEAGVRMQRVATPGLAFDLGLGYRIDPRWALGAAGQYYELTSARSSGVRGITAGVAATYHVAPYVRSDPWVQFGAGYRWLWEDHDAPAADVLARGLELAKASAGFDVRVSERVAVSPVVGADLTLFLWHSHAGSDVINDPRPSAFMYIGLQGRFDLRAVREPRDKGAVARR